MLKILSSGIGKIANLEAFLSEERALYSDPERIEAVAGWGFKETSAKARALAAKLQVPYIALEDGFLRSLDLGVNGAQPLSISVDPKGCYYASDSASLIEDLLSNPGEWYTSKLAVQAKEAMALILSLQLSKYNAAPDAKALLAKQAAETVTDNNDNVINYVNDNDNLLQQYFSAKDKILILDQCLGDASLLLGQVPEDAAERMLQKAAELYPNFEIFLKVHPDVLCCRRQGLLYPHLKQQSRVKIISADVNVISLLKVRPTVFTASSQSGFEALLCSCPVHCFGLPFYAGYGLTADEVSCPRRNAVAGVSLELLFAAAYLKLCRYVNPVSAQRCSIFDVIELLAVQKKINDENRGGAVVFGVRRWKRPILRAFLGSTQGRVSFSSNAAQALASARHEGSALVQWASRKDLKLDLAARASGIKVLYAEDGFLRSVGLGCNHVRPFSLVFDRGGIYYDPDSHSSLEQILNAVKGHPEHDRLTAAADVLREQIVAAGLSKYNVGQSRSAELQALKKAVSAARAAGRQVILVPGQVEDDASVLRAGSGIVSNAQLLCQVRTEHPDAFVIYKPHPDVLSLNRRAARVNPQSSAAADASLRLFDLEVREVSISSLFALVDKVCTLTSLSGFEALLRGIEVRVYGRPFYAGWGLTSDKCSFKERTAILTLSELIAGVLILYPRYFDWCSGMFMRPMDAVYRLQHLEPKTLPSDPLFVRAVRIVYALRRSIYYKFAKEQP